MQLNSISIFTEVTGCFKGSEEGGRRDGEQASIGDIAHEDLRNSVLSIFNLQMSTPQKSACKTG